MDSSSRSGLLSSSKRVCSKYLHEWPSGSEVAANASAESARADFNHTELFAVFKHYPPCFTNCLKFIRKHISKFSNMEDGICFKGNMVFKALSRFIFLCLFNNFTSIDFHLYMLFLFLLSVNC